MKPAPMTNEQFAVITQLLSELAGLAFEESRRESIGYSISERMRATGCKDVGDYLHLLFAADANDERQALLDEVTIPETHFFRNPPQIRALRTHVLPDLLREASTTKRLRIWSAGCSTGEEPYTLAMLIRQLVPPQSDWDIKIIATDISARALTAAREAKYAERSFVMTEPLDRQRFFYLDADSGAFVVRDDVRELVEFRHHNLVTEVPPVAPGEVDIVLCRNVTIYFDRKTTKRLMQRFHSCLRDGGYLFLGHAETLWQVSDDFSLVSLGDAFVYRRGAVTDNRAILPDRRTEDELRPTRADRRRGPVDRRAMTPAPTQPTPESPGPESPGPLSPGPESPGPDPMIAVRTAVAAGNYQDAASLAADVTAASPLRAEAHYLHGLALTNLGRDADALVVLRKAVYLDPYDGYAHFLLAGALGRSGESIAAARSYQAAAMTLGARPHDDVARELGGRSVAELAALCRELARRADRRPMGPQP